MGLTDREQYIHRLGRTERAGKSGEGLLLLADYEANALVLWRYLPNVFSGTVCSVLTTHP